MAVGAVLSCLLLPFGWVTPTWADLPWLIALGLLSGLGQFLWVQGCRDAPASVAAPFGYGHMVFAMIFGFAIWEDVPDIPLIVGSLVVSGAGLFILFYETRTRGR
jgi:drug/metabolite transporter (DMT)-like permease